MKVALFGDSYISRLGRFCDYSLQVPAEVRFFGRGGMTASRYDTELFESLMSFSPDAVIINIGGNDVRSDSKPSKIAEDVFEIVNKLEERNIKVFVCEILPRGRFPKDINLSEKSFSAQRCKINSIFQKNVSVVKLPIRYPRDYDSDLVHFSENDGQRRFLFRH